MPYAALELTPDLFIAFAKHCHLNVAHQIRVIQNGLPDDVVVERVRLSRRNTHNVELILQSDAFPAVPEDAEIPLLQSPVFEVVY